MALTPGTLLNERYRIISILGQGGMGAVYRAIDEHLEISVAVKENLFLSEDYSRQFKREAAILAGLRHPNLPRVADYFSIPGQGQYLVMDYIDGEDLRQRIERVNTVPEQEVILIGVAICEALSYLHSRTPPIIHRDIKPGNIKITPEGEIALVDFGLAKVMRGSQATTTGARAMTPGYSPPEQYGTARTDVRTDVYSLGATLYAALTGIIPEDGLARATGKAELTSIRQLQPKIERRLAAVIEKSLAIEPEDRYQTAEEFKKALIEVSGHRLEQLTAPRYRISPPPPASESQNSRHSDNELEELPSAMLPKQPNRTQPRKVFASILILAFLTLAVGAAIYWPNFPASIYHLLFTPTAVSVTVTPSTSEVVTIADTATMEPTPSKTATIIPTNTSPPFHLTPSATALPVTGQVGGGSGQIAFVSKRTGNYQIHIMNADGSNQRQLTNIPEGACQPNWSPDGKKLVFISPCNPKNNSYPDAKIYILASEDESPILLPVSIGGDYDPAWSPDGKRIAFTSLRNQVAHTFVYNFENGTLAELSDTRYPDIHPAWNPSYKMLAVARKATYYYHIWLISDNGQTIEQFSSSGDVNDFWPDWSSDGKFILFGRTKIDLFLPWLLKTSYEDRGTGKEYRIPPAGKVDPGPVAQARLSPDMQWIVFEGWPDGNNHDIYRMDINGDNLLRLTTDPAIDFNPVWRPLIR
jgi:serine/threonine protein kinase